MNFFQEYALLIAIAVPSLTVVGINVFLMVMGEKGTLLLPTLGRFPSLRLTLEETPSSVSGNGKTIAANEEFEREAA